MAKKPLKLKPFRVSFYFKDEVEDGVAPLAGMTVVALDAEDAVTQVLRDSQDPKTGEQPLVTVKAYHSSRPYKVPTRQTYIKVAPPTSFVGTTVNAAQSSTVDVIFPDPATIVGPSEVRNPWISSPSGTYAWPVCSPNCALCAEGRRIDEARAAADKAIGDIVGLENDFRNEVAEGISYLPPKFGSFGGAKRSNPVFWIGIILMLVALGYLAASYGGVSYLKHLAN